MKKALREKKKKEFFSASKSRRKSKLYASYKVNEFFPSWKKFLKQALKGI